jgi:hypothetical protein
MSDQLALTIALIFIAAIAFWAFRSITVGPLKKRNDGVVTVLQWEAGLKYRKGVFVATLAPGRYYTWPAPVTITRIDLRAAAFSVPNQEVLTSDKMAVRASAIVTYRIVDPKAYLAVDQAPASQLYDAVQMGLRDRAAAKSLDEILADRGLLEAGLAAEIGARARPLGIAIEAVRVRDITLVGPAKQAFADLWKAQKEGQAALERARGEQAALRALANAARLLKGNPELMNLRVLQALGGGPGKPAPTVVLGGASGLLPVSREIAAEAPAAPED